jgi:hypothetical protein
VQVGAAKLQDGLSLNYAGIEGFRIAGNQGLLVIAACQVWPITAALGAWLQGPPAVTVGRQQLPACGIDLSTCGPEGLPFHCTRPSQNSFKLMTPYSSSAAHCRWC